MVFMNRDPLLAQSEIQGYIDTEVQLIGLAYANGILSENGIFVEDAHMSSSYLKLYQQTSHEVPGAVKGSEMSRFIEISAKSPLEWISPNYIQPDTLQYEGFSNLWVYDDYREPCKLIEYLEYFYTELYPQGFALGVSPMALFERANGKRLLARCLQLDLEVGEDEWDTVLKELQQRIGTEELYGFICKSSSNGLHFYGNQYEVYSPEGLIVLASRYGSALLLNRENCKSKIDGRSTGHQLKSFVEKWQPKIVNAETGSLRATVSLLKREHPEFISFSPID